MKKRKIALIALLLFTLVFGINATTTAEPARLAKEDFQIGGIAVFDSIDKVIEVYGEPNCKKEKIIDRKYIIYSYDMGLDFYVLEKDNSIYLIGSVK